LAALPALSNQHQCCIAALSLQGGMRSQGAVQQMLPGGK
jgi:hypothetical protein